MTNHVTVDCANCGADICLSTAMYARRRSDGQSFYCPNGHSNHYTPEPTDDQKRIAELEKQLAAMRRLDARWSADREQLYASRDELVTALKQCPGGCGWHSRCQIPRHDEERMRRGIERVRDDVALHLMARHGATAQRRELEAAR